MKASPPAPKTFHRVVLVLILSVVLLFGSSTPLAAQVETPPSPIADGGRVAAALQSSSVMFIENVGQFDAGARFQVRGSNSSVYLANDAIWFTLQERPQTETASVGASRAEDRLVVEKEAPAIKVVNLKLSFGGANPNPVIEPFGRFDTHVSYFIGSDPEKWRSDVPVWGGVRYKDLYPGIDLEVTSDGGRMIQRIVTRSGANLDAVRLQVEGADSVSLNGDQLALTTAVGEFVLPLFPLLVDHSADPKAGRSEAQVANLVPYLFKDETSGAGSWEISAPFAVGAEGTRNKQPLGGLSGASDLLYATFLGGAVATMATASLWMARATPT